MLLRYRLLNLRLPNKRAPRLCVRAMSSFRYVVLGGGNASGYAANRFLNNGVSPEEVCVITDEPVSINPSPLNSHYSRWLRMNDLH